MSKISISNHKLLLSTVIAVMFLLVGFLGGNWDQAFATTTIPVVDTITPSQIEVNSPDTQFLIEGADFIGQWGTEWTLVRWEGPDGLVLEVEPDFITLDGTKMYVTFPSYLFTQHGVAEITIINHPEDPLLKEESSPLFVKIVSYIYLPLIMK